MDPGTDKLEEKIELVASDQPEPAGAAQIVSAGTPKQVDEDRTEEVHGSPSRPDKPRSEAERTLKDLGRSASALLTSVIVGVFLWLAAPPHGWVPTVTFLVAGLICLVALIHFLVTAGRSARIWWKQTPVQIKLGGITALNGGVIGSMLLSWGKVPSSLDVGLGLMLFPPSALWFYRQFKIRQKLKAASTLPIDQSSDDGGQSHDSEAAPELTHELLHSARLIKTCTASCDIMKNVGDSCMKTCHRCGSTVFRPEELQPEDLRRLAKIRSTRIATNQDARTYRRTDGSYVLGSCSVVATHSLPAPVLSAPFFLTGLSLVMAPGFIVPFLNHPVARIVVLLATIWHLSGCWLYTRTNLIALRALIIMVFSLPLLLAPMLGPAIITIWQALGTVH
jgi:hypothetical protein